MRMLWSLSLCLFATLPVLAGAEESVTNLKVKPEVSTITYRVVHKLHKVEGVSKQIDGRARVQGGGPTQVAIRVPIESFDSDNVNRDAHMKEVMDAARYPYVEVKAVADGLAIPTSFPATVQKSWKAQVSLHGITQTMEIPVTVQFESANRIVATASFSISFDAYKIERPSLMFVKVEDAIKIDAKLTFTP